MVIFLKLTQAKTILTHLGRKFNLIGNNERETSLIETLPIYLKLFEDFLLRHGKKWFIGDILTIADFQLFEYLDHCEECEKPQD